MDKITGKEMVKNMEYLMKLLYKEWERSGRTKAEVSIDITNKKEVGARLTAEIQERQKQLEAAGMDFKECMELTKENFVLLRLAKKVKKAGNRLERRDKASFLIVKMDKEEYKLFSALIRAQEV